MGYYRGDYYRGDYYRGGGIIDFVKGVGRGLLAGAGAVAGTIIGGPSTGIAVGTGILKATARAPGTAVATIPQIQPPMTGPMPTTGPVQPGPQSVAAYQGQLMTRPTGYHLNKSTYMLRNGAVRHAGTEWVRNRTMNPCNVRALRRGMRRVEGFAKIAKRVMVFKSTHRLKATRKKRS